MISPVAELELFTKYLKKGRDELHHEEITSPRKLDTHNDVAKAYSQQHMPTIPQFYEHVRHRNAANHHECFALALDSQRSTGEETARGSASVVPASQKSRDRQHRRCARKQQSVAGPIR